MRVLRKVLFVLIPVALTAAVPAQTQAPVTAADITRLETSAADIERLAAALKKSDPTLAAEVEKTLAELRDEVTYLKVKQRRDNNVTREEYQALRDRLETLRTKASGSQKVAAQPMLGDPDIRVRIWTVAVGTEFDVRLQTPLNSATAKVEQRFEATTILDYTIGKDLVIPAGSTARGFVSSVRAAGKIDRKGSLTLSFDELRIENRSFKLRASVTQALDGKVGQDVTRIGTGAAVGAIIGGILGGSRGALVGVLVGGGGTIAATDGADVDLPLGTILRIRIDQPLEIGEDPVAAFLSQAGEGIREIGLVVHALPVRRTLREAPLFFFRGVPGRLSRR